MTQPARPPRSRSVTCPRLTGRPCGHQRRFDALLMFKCAGRYCAPHLGGGLLMKPVEESLQEFRILVAELVYAGG
jgi:hypothetical protein